MRQINQIHKVFEKILNLTKRNNFDKAGDVIKTAVKILTGLNIQLVPAFNMKELLVMIKNYDNNIDTDKNKLFSVSKLIHEQAKIENFFGNLKIAQEYQKKAILFLTHICNLNNSDFTEDETKIINEQFIFSKKIGLSESLLNDFNSILKK
ncbi:MAG: hypothetical protein OEZ22_04765 [Spirochaetia bacterium]|nr:hypothetical protein [Spirochaetia bacterium]